MDYNSYPEYGTLVLRYRYEETGLTNLTLTLVCMAIRAISFPSMCIVSHAGELKFGVEY
jgi:hypothetical protein